MDQSKNFRGFPIRAICFCLFGLWFLFLFSHSQNSAAAGTASQDSWYFRPTASYGYNNVQGSHFTLGADLGLHATDDWRVGLSGHYSAGEEPERDREYGGGVFTSYALQMGEVLVGHIREEVDYLDQRRPVTPDDANSPNYKNETGLAS